LEDGTKFLFEQGTVTAVGKGKRTEKEFLWMGGRKENCKFVGTKEGALKTC